ncbi:MAG: hypothetical protein PWP24_1323 [Clostridiales bacterium]|nr:hypothetical protein [Clostridiales bacterium]
MRICKQCQCQMEEGYMLKANTYGSIKIERGTPKTDGIKIAICPTCGEISMYLVQNPHNK